MSRALVDEFLRALEARDLPKTQAMLAPGAIMTFPGNHRFETVEALANWSKGRYRSVKKTYHGFDEMAGDGVSTSLRP